MEENERSDVLGNVVRIVEVTTKSEVSNDLNVVRLTPTGKISHAKTRVYTQRYRKEWENMTDFKDWLTSVPDQVTKAHCKYCERDLHAHRLSLLKHMCTLKHQRAAVHYNKRQSLGVNINEINLLNESRNSEKSEENIEYDYIECNDEESFNQEEEIIEDDVQEVIEDFDNEVNEQNSKKIRLSKATDDTMVQALLQTNSETIENNDPIEVQMIVDSENDNEDDSDAHFIQFEEQRDDVENKIISDEKIKKLNTISADGNLKNTISISGLQTSTISSDNVKQMLVISANGKSYIVNSKPQSVVLSPNLAKNIAKINKNVACELVSKTSNSNKQESVPKSTSKIKNSESVKKSILSTHVLETSKGFPVSGLQVSLYKLTDGRWTFIHESTTSADGNCNDFTKNSDKSTLSTGRYKFHYDVEKYYASRKTATIYPFIEIVFDIKDPRKSYHVPLLLSPYSYSTYRDSFR